MKAIGYIRQSRRADLDVALSPEQQRTDILRLAERDGLDPESVTIFSDLGRSGGQGKERLRTGYTAVLKALEGGEASVLYAKALSRLGRSVSELYNVLKAAQRQGVKIITAKEGAMDPSTPMGQAQFGMMAVFAQFERDLAVERARDNVATRRSRGERMGRAPYGEKAGEDPTVVIRAFQRSGSLNAAALWLNEQMIPSPLGRLWSGPSVRNVIRRSDPSVLPRHTSHGVRPSSPFLFYRILRCACGRFLTASRDNRRPDGPPIYRCHAADTEPLHHRPYRVREDVLMEWVKAEAGRLRTPDRVTMAGDETSRQRDVLQAQRERVGIAFADGLMTRETANAKVVDIDLSLMRLGDVEAVAEVPEIDWSWDAKTLNGVLSALWEYVQLDTAMEPVKAVWRVPEWRA